MKKSYNALNSFYRGDYGEIKKALENYGSWPEAWKKIGTDSAADKEWEKMRQLGINLALKEDKDYPSFLKEIANPPFGIYFLGDLNYRQPALAIVGTRAATPQGNEIAKSFAKSLSSAGVPIVSGLALGIDAAAHQGALDSGGKTIAVLGTPLNHLYPKQNEKLAKEILKNNGAIISEFPLNCEYYPKNFLIRNRIISGLASAVLIVEAPEKSGALATAKFALEQGREIFVVPGNIHAKNYGGSNELIKAGATPVTEPKDILDYFGMETKTESDAADLLAADNSPEGEVVRAVKKERLSVEQLLRVTKINLGQLNKILALLIIKGIIKESNGKYHL